MTPSLKANNVSYAVDEKVLISGVELDLQPGVMMAVVGPNGAGKSTLCGVLAGDLSPMEGNVEVCGRTVRETNPSTLALLRSMLAQQTQIRFPFTTREVVMMGRHPHISRWKSPTEADFLAAEYAMESAEVTHLARRVYPTLSGGEQRRVSLARVLAQDTPVILLDEPTNALDIAHQQMVMSVCRQLADEGRVIFAVLHDLNLAAAFADTVMVMSEGRVVAIGSPEEVLTPHLLSEVFNQDVIVISHPQTKKPVILAASNGATKTAEVPLNQRLNGNRHKNERRCE